MGGSQNFFIDAINPVDSQYDPVHSLLKSATGHDIKLNAGNIAYDKYVVQPGKDKENIEQQIKQQEEEARKAEEEYKQEQSEEKKRKRDLAFQNLQRMQAQYKSQRGGGQKGGYSGTILTSPLGVSGNPSAAAGQKTLLGL